MGCKQTLHRVTHWPGQQRRNAQSKVPSLIWYDGNNKAKSFGAEAQARETKLKAKKKGWELARRFKLHLYPPNFLTKRNLVLDPLPSRVPLHQIYSDFLGYLLEIIRERFGTSITRGTKVWQDYYHNMEVVIGYPSGYGTRELEFLRSAVVDAGFTTSDKARSHVHFVTEAEASVYFCLHYTDLRNRLNVGTNFAVCDAGGTTVDTTLYTVRGIAPTPRLKELRRSACVQAGATIVDKMAETRLRQLLAKAELSPSEVIECLIRGTKDFEMNTKRRFDDASKDWSIEIGDSECSIPALRVRRGKLRLKGSAIRAFFDRSVKDIIASVNVQVSSVPVPYILLVGGFGDSPYLRKELNYHFDPMGIQVVTSNNTSAKAVIDGAIRWYCANPISRGAPRYTYGTEVDLPLDQANVEHGDRTQVDKPSGVYVSGKWYPLVQKGMAIDHDTTIRQTHTREYLSHDLDLGVLNEGIYRCSLDNPPSWLTTQSGELLDGFQKVCSVSAELSGMWKALHPRINALGDRYWALTFNVCFLFGRTRLEAFLEWAEEDAIKTMPAIIISDPKI